MNSTLTLRTRAAFASGALCLAFVPAASHAQAWLPPKGSLILSIDYNEVLNKKHYTASGDEIDVGHTDMQAMSIGVLYGLSDRFMLKAGLPYMKTRYRGPGLGGHDTEIDNGSWHGTFTDLQLSLHYQVTDGPIAFAPYIGALIPTDDYVTQGHAAPGRGVNEYWLGFYVGSSLNEWIPRTYVQARYNYAFVEKVADISHDRSNIDLEIGYFLNPDWSVRVLGAWQDTHGGIDVPVPVTSPLFPYHDVLASASFLNLGGGVSWVINDRVAAYGLYMQALHGKDAHKVDHRVSLGISYSLGNR
jgi:hypothetical protein